MAKKVYCKVNEYNDVIEAVRGEDVVMDKSEDWLEVTDVEDSHALTEMHHQKRVKVFPQIRKASGEKIKAKRYMKPDFKLTVDKRKISANGEDCAVLKLESLQEIEWPYPVKLQVNGQVHEVMVGEEIQITSDVNQRIGVACVDPDIKVVPKALFVQATGGKPRESRNEAHPSRR